MELLYKAYDKIKGVVVEWGDQGVKLIPNIITAILIFILFYIVSKFVTKKFGRFLRKKMPGSTLVDLGMSLLHIFILAIGALTCLGILHLDKTVTTVLAGMGVLGLALSFAFQHTSHDFLSGVVLAIKSPINVGDIIETNDVFGKVKRIGLRATYIDNNEGQLVAVPNRLVLDDKLKAYSVNQERRITIEGSVAYSSHLKESEKVIIEGVKKVKKLNHEKPIEFFYTEFGDNGVHFMVRFWINFTNSQSEFLQAKSDAYRYIKIACDENNIEIPYPHRVMHVYNRDKSEPINGGLQH